MAHMSPLFLVVYLLASGRGGGRSGRSPTKSGRGRGGRSGRGGRRGGGRGRGDLGRHRYTRDGTKKKPPSNNDESTSRQEELHPLPPLTVPNGPRPSYYTCRHSYENTLIDEIQRHASAHHEKMVVATSPYPGLVRVEDPNNILPSHFDPVYALQCLPQCVVVSAESIKGIAREVLSALLGGDQEDGGTMDERSKQTRQQLRTAQKGSLTIHPLVPGMCKGQANPIMLHRSTKVGEEVSKMLKKSFAAVRKASTTSSIKNDGDTLKEEPPSKEGRCILQIMLQSPNIAVASLTACAHVGPGQNAYWPNTVHPLGLAKVDITERMPSSAYRKLMEGIECMGIRPGGLSKATTTTVVDLGACPGGWTSVIRRYFDSCHVIGVDRSELDASLMKDPMVTFVKGDAFTYEPPHASNSEDEVDDHWMISDVIAYPERATELLSRWCTNKWASNMIVTMKFQGDEPDLDELDNAIHIVEKLGYACRVKHFFNNKNEVTFMVSERYDNEAISSGNLEVGVLGTPMYPSL